MNISRQVVILSAELKTETTEANKRRTNNLESCLVDMRLPFKRGTGVYKGTEEVSLVVIVNDELDVQTV
jgi:hypothetical protein